MTSARPVLVDVRPAIDIVPSLSDIVLTSGTQPLPLSRDYVGRRRKNISGACYKD